MRVEGLVQVEGLVKGRIASLIAEEEPAGDLRAEVVDIDAFTSKP